MLSRSNVLLVLALDSSG